MISAILVMCIGDLSLPDNAYCMQYTQPLLVANEEVCVSMVADFLNSEIGRRRLEEGWYFYDYRCIDWFATTNAEGDPV